MHTATTLLCHLSILSLTKAYISNPDDLPLSQRQKHFTTKIPTPPFPDGPNLGRVVTIPGGELYKSNNNVLSAFNPFAFYQDVILPRRDVTVWLPREYDSEEFGGESFPILYCHDGQNAMTDSTSWTGRSWRLTGAISRLHEHNMLHIPTPPIIILIPSADRGTIPKSNFPPGWNQRHSEYGDIVLPMSQAHGHFVAKVLHPYIMERFRVKEGPEHTYTIGSSLGGQASLQLVLRYPEIFGGAACMSPCFQAGTIAATVANLVRENGEHWQSLRSKRIYMDNGGDIGDTRVPMFDIMDHFTMNENWWNPGFFWLDTQLQPTIDAVRWTLEKGNVDFEYKKYPGARHNERAWSNRIHEPLLHLYGKTMT